MFVAVAAVVVVVLFVAVFAVVEVVIANRDSNACVHRGPVNVLSPWDQVLEGPANALSFAELVAVAQVTLSASEVEVAAASAKGILIACVGQAVEGVREISSAFEAVAAAALGPANVLASAYHHKELETSISPWR